MTEDDFKKANELANKLNQAFAEVSQGEPFDIRIFIIAAGTFVSTYLAHIPPLERPPLLNLMVSGIVGSLVKQDMEQQGGNPSGKVH